MYIDLICLVIFLTILKSNARRKQMNYWALLSYFIIVISLCLFFINRKHKPIFNYFTIFCGVWIIVFTLDMINLYELNKVSDKFYSLLFMGILFWIVGFLIANKSKVKLSVNKKNNVKYSYSLNKNILLIYTIIMIVFTVIIMFAFFRYMSSGKSYVDFHRLAFGDKENESLFASSMLTQLNSRLFYSIVLATIPVVVISLFTEKKKVLPIITLIVILAYCLLLGRRFPLMYLILNLFLVLPLLDIKLPRVVLKSVLIGSGLLLILIILFTAWRKDAFVTGDWKPVFETFYLYFNICLPIGDYWVGVIDESYKNMWMYGYSVLSGIFNNIHFLFGQIGIDIFNNEVANKIINLPQDYYIQVGYHKYYNAFATWIYYLYLDFRYLGVIIGSFIFGMGSGYLERRTYNKKDDYLQIAIYLLFSQAVLKTFVRLEFGAISYILAFIYIRLLFRKRNRIC